MFCRNREIRRACWFACPTEAHHLAHAKHGKHGRVTSNWLQLGQVGQMGVHLGQVFGQFWTVFEHFVLGLGHFAIMRNGQYGQMDRAENMSTRYIGLFIQTCFHGLA